MTGSRGAAGCGNAQGIGAGGKLLVSIDNLRLYDTFGNFLLRRNVVFLSKIYVSKFFVAKRRDLTNGPAQGSNPCLST
jgi:hypothetical protein